MTSKIPVILVSNFLSGLGGTRGVCEELAVRLEANGTPVVVTSDKKARLHRLYDMLRTTWQQREHFLVAQVDVYSGPAFIWAEMVCALLRRLNKPFILTLHGGNLPSFAAKNPFRVRRLLNSASAVTTPSEYLQETMGTFHTDLKLLPNALHLSRYDFRLRCKPLPNLVWLRAFHSVYNPTQAVKVLSLISNSYPQSRLLMAGPDKGDGTCQEVRELAADLGVSGQMHLPGGIPKTRVPIWLNQGDIFLNTTNIDNAPVSVLEAMACGLCVVSTNVGGLPYMLRHEKDALLVPPANPLAMAEAVKRILADPALAWRLSENGRNRLAKHDWSVVLPQWETLFREVALRGRGVLPLAAQP